jgi:hypothetical protein
LGIAVQVVSAFLSFACTNGLVVSDVFPVLMLAKIINEANLGESQYQLEEAQAI